MTTTPSGMIGLSGVLDGAWSDGSQLLVCPDWSLVLLGALLPAARFVGRRVRHHRQKAGKCPACGYDLTGNVSGVCPECGDVR